MGIFSKDIRTMEDLFLHSLQDIYYAENQITKTLPKMIEAATNPEVKSEFEQHLQETKAQVERLDQAFQKLGKESKGVDCPAIDGIIKESNEIAGEIDDKSIMDSALIASAQAVEHYEINRYMTLIVWAEALGHHDVIKLLTSNLEEEKSTSAKLQELAVRNIYWNESAPVQPVVGLDA